MKVSPILWVLLAIGMTVPAQAAPAPNPAQVEETIADARSTMMTDPKATIAKATEARAAAVKLSGPFRYSHQAWPYAECEPFVEALIGAYTLDNCVWGSDWPFVRLPQRFDYGPTRQLLDRWIPDAADRRHVLWDTPRRWFGFADVADAARS